MVLFTALIGPHFVDWTSYRETFEREASAYVGRPVTVAGKANVRLLPTPVVSFTNIRVGDADAPDVEMERFRAEVELTPLLRGEVRIIQMAIERPVFRIDLANLAGGAGARSGGFRLDPERVSLERLAVVDGSALIVDGARERTWRADHIDAVVEADTLMGPGKMDASFTLDGEAFAVSIGFGRTDGDSVAAKASVRSSEYPVTLSTDGTFSFAGEDSPKFEGSATAVGVVPADPQAPRSHWADFRASGGFELTLAGLSVNAMQVSYGAMERPLILEAAGALGFGDAPRFDLSLAARQIDIDRTLGGRTENPVAIEAAVPALLGKLPALPMPPIPGDLRLEAQGMVVGGGVIQAVSAHLRTGDDAWLVDDFAATLPGETRVALSGDFGSAAAPTFKGHAHVASRRPSAFAAWWRGEVGSAARIGSFALDADVDVRPGLLSFADLTATTGAGTTSGAVDIRRFPQTGRYFVSIDLRADRADLVQTRALAELLVGKSIAPSKIEQMTVALRADVLTAGGVEARSIAIEGGFEDGELDLRKLSVADLAGANIEASGTVRDPFGKRSGNIEASIRAEDFSGAAEFLASLAPELQIVRRLRDVAPILSPVVAEVSAEAGAEGSRLSLSLTGSFAATHLLLQAEGEGTLDDLASLSGTVKLHVDGEDSATVLRQLGLNPLPLLSTPLSIDADFEGALASSGTLKITGAVAGVSLDYSAETALREGKPTLAGAFKAESGDIDQALLLAGIAVPGIGEGHAASAAGRLEYSNGAIDATIEEGSFNGGPANGTLNATFAPGAKLSGTLTLAAASLPVLTGFATGTVPEAEDGKWSDTPFAAPLPDNLTLDLAVNAKTLDIGAPVSATGAKLAFALSGGKFQLDLTAAEFAGGTLKGALTAVIADGEADLALRGGLTGASLEALTWERAGLPVVSGAVDLSFDVAGHGRSAAGLVATLVGSGSFSVDEGRINALNPEALTTVMAAAEGDEEPDDTAARETFAQMFGSGALGISRAAGSFSIANGIMSIPTVSLESDATAILADATFDLNRLTLASQWQLRTGDAGADEAQPYVQMRFSGAIDNPDRQVDLNPLLNLLRSRFLQRQLDKLEALEAERQRIEAEEKAEAERQRIETERQAEEVRRAREEAMPKPDEPPATGATGETPAAPAPIAVEPAPVAPPMQLVPEAEPPAETPPPPRRAQTSVPPPQAGPVQPLPQYRVLPNGTIVKIR